MGNHIFASFIWRLLERFGSQGINFVVSIILARRLGPEAYGVITLANVFTAILLVFVERGFGTALIQKKDANECDFSSVFFFNSAISLTLYIALFLIAPFISRYYGIQELTSVLRALGLVLICSGLKNVQQAYVSRHLQFRKFFFSTIIATICGGTLGITMAYQGYGVWALVAQTVINEFVGTIVLWFSVKWRPQLLFSWKRLFSLINYGWKLLVSGLIDTIYNKLRDLIIGKKYSTDDLAFYNKGNQLPSVLVINISTALDSVLFPTLSKVQDDKQTVKSITRKSIQLSSFIIMPMMVGVFVCADSIIRILLTEKWISCVPYLRIACTTYAFYMIHTANLNTINAIGRSDIFLKLEILKKSIGLIVIILTIKYGPYILACSGIITTFISMLINCYPNKKLLGYGFIEQIVDIFPSIITSCVMGLLVWLISFIRIDDILKLVIQVFAGVLIYIALAMIFNSSTMNFLISTLRGKRKND